MLSSCPRGGQNVGLLSNSTPLPTNMDTIQQAMINYTHLLRYKRIVYIKMSPNKITIKNLINHEGEIKWIMGKYQS